MIIMDYIKKIKRKILTNIAVTKNPSKTEKACFG